MPFLKTLLIIFATFITMFIFKSIVVLADEGAPQANDNGKIKDIMPSVVLLLLEDKPQSIKTTMLIDALLGGSISIPQAADCCMDYWVGTGVSSIMLDSTFAASIPARRASGRRTIRWQRQAAAIRWMSSGMT